MVKIVKILWRLLSVFTLSVFLWFGFSFSFVDFFKLPYQIYVLRWRDFHSAELLVDYWGRKPFDSGLWKTGVERAPQAIDLFFKKKLLGLTRVEVEKIVEKIMGPSDGDYVLSDSNLTYRIIDHSLAAPREENGARWSLVLMMSDGVVREVKFYHACCK